MILKDIAERTGLDISTISSVSNSKYIQTNFGIYPLKYFFSEGMQKDDGEEVSTREIKKILQECIENEDKHKPLTDEKLAQILKEKSYNIARRTVAKYREQLGIPVARLRKELINMSEKISKIISIVFHPVLGSHFGHVLLLLNSGFYFSMLSGEAKRFILLVLLFSTGIMPMLTIAVLALNPKFDVNMPNSHDRIFPLLFSSAFYYLGFMLLNKMNAFPVFKVIYYCLGAGNCCSFSGFFYVEDQLPHGSGWERWQEHFCAFISLRSKSGLVNHWYCFISGIVGTARLILKKHNIWQIAAGYFSGFLILYLVIYFI